MAKNALGFSGNESQGAWRKGEAEFSWNGTTVTMKVNDEIYKFDEDLLPEYPREIRSEFPYFVEFVVDESEKVSKIDNVRPMKWMGVKMKAIDITRPDPEKVEPPAPYSYTANYSGKEVEETAFYIFYQCVDEEDEFFGTIFPNKYFYKFKPRGDGFTTFDGSYDNPKATRLHRVVDHLSTLGVLEYDIEWPDDGNILPELLARMLSVGKVVETAGGGRYASITEMVESKQQRSKPQTPPHEEAPQEAQPERSKRQRPNTPDPEDF